MIDTASDRTPLSWPRVNARRLDRSAITTPLRDAEPADIVAAICGAHAQVLTAAELSIGLRLAGSTRTDIRRALWDERSLVKTFGPRGTVHLLPSRDLPMWIGALSARPTGPNSFSHDVRLTPAQMDKVVAAIEIALDDAELTIDELGDAVIATAGDWAGDMVMPAFNGMWPRWRQAIGLAASQGVLCFGPNRGRKITYTSPHRWLPGLTPMDGAVALARLVQHYLHAYGPATPQEFAQWLGAPRAWASDLFESLKGDIEVVELEGNPAWVVAGDTGVPSHSPSGVRLLPYFDAFAVASQPRELLFPGRASERALAGSQAGNYPVMLVDGVVAGVWHLRTSGRKLDITVESLEPLTPTQRSALEEQVERIGEFLEGAARLTVGPVTVGPHA